VQDLDAGGLRQAHQVAVSVEGLIGREQDPCATRCDGRVDGVETLGQKTARFTPRRGTVQLCI